MEIKDRLQLLHRNHQRDWRTSCVGKEYIISVVQGSRSEPGKLPQIHNKAIAGTKEVLESHNSGQLPLCQKKQAPRLAGADLPMLNLAMIPPCSTKRQSPE